MFIKCPTIIVLEKSSINMILIVCMYIILTPRRVASFFWKVLSFYTHYIIGTALSTVVNRSGLLLGAGASGASPGISIGQTATVVVRTPYISSYVSALPYRWDFGLGNRTRDMLPVFWSPHQGAGSFLLDLRMERYMGQLLHQEVKRCCVKQEAAARLMHTTTALLFWERCVPSVGRLRHQSFATATVRERSQRTDGLVPLRSLLWDRSVPTYKRATPYHFLRLPLFQKWRCGCVKAMAAFQRSPWWISEWTVRVGGVYRGEVEVVR